MKNMKLRLFVTMGAPGSGKSYFAERYCKEFGFACLRSDEIRKIIFPKPTYTQEEQDRLFATIDFMAGKLLASGISVVYDANFSSRAFRAKRAMLAKKYGARFCILWTKAPLELSIKRTKSRSFHPIDEETVRSVAREIELPKNEQVIELDGTKPYRFQKLSVMKWAKKAK